MKLLSLSDDLISFIYSPQVRIRFKDVDLILGCGDLAYYYLEYVYNALGVPLCFVRGNHDKVIEYGTGGQRTYPHGGIDLHRRIYHHNGLILAGVEGSLRYRPGRFQYSQSEMWAHVFSLVPFFLLNRMIHGRAVDVIITHSPPAGIHDQSDLPHQGIKAFRWMIDVFKPRYFFHGHVHILRPDTPYETVVGVTRVINTYGFRETTIEM